MKIYDKYHQQSSMKRLLGIFLFGGVVKTSPKKYTSRRTGNRARENRVLPKNVCFVTGRQQLWSLEKCEFFGLPNLGVFLVNCDMRYSKTWISCLFRLDNCSLLFHSIFRSICAVLSSSVLYLLMNLNCHILAYNMTSLCLAPKELGMDFLQLVHAASIVPVSH